MLKHLQDPFWIENLSLPVGEDQRFVDARLPDPDAEKEEAIAEDEEVNPAGVSIPHSKPGWYL